MVERSERIVGDLGVGHWSLELLSWGISRILGSRIGFSDWGAEMQCSKGESGSVK